MRVVCIDNTRGNARHLDIGNIYDARVELFKHMEFYVIRSIVYSNPTHRVGILPERDIWIKKDWVGGLVTLEEYRSVKLESIGI